MGLRRKEAVLQEQVVLGQMEGVEQQPAISIVEKLVNTEAGLAELGIAFEVVGRNLCHPVPPRKHLKQVDTLFQFWDQEMNKLLAFLSTLN